MEISTELEDDFVNTVDSSGADDIDALGLEVANYLINLESVNVVAKKSMVVSTILKKKGLYQLALEKASELISDAYGYALKEAKDGKEVLIFLVAPVSMSNADYIPEEVQKMKNLLMIILGYIYLKGGRASETALVGFLNKLDIDVPEDEYFGNVNDLLHSFFTMQYYLKRQKETEKTTGDVKFHYEWGVRSDLEVEKEHLLEHLALILKKPIQSFSHLRRPAAATELSRTDGL